MLVRDLSCEDMSRPVIGVLTPRLKWRLQSPIRGDAQTAYQVQAGSSAGAADLWDSGKVTSSAQAATYAGSALAARQRVYWQVRVWDAASAVSQWATSSFELGLLANSDWGSALMIGYQTGASASGGYPAACVRKTFTVAAKTITRARLYATALGFYRPHLNGQRVGQVELAPGWTDPTKRLHAQAYDVTSLLTSGAASVLGLQLGDGHIQGNISTLGRGYYGNDVPRAACALFIDYADGTTDTIVSDASWKGTASANTLNDLYLGSSADTRNHLPFASTAVSDSGWGVVSTKALGSVPIQMQPYPHIRRQETLTAVAVTNPSAGVYVFDLGQNHAGIPRLTVSGLARGTTVTLQAAEDTKKDGSGTLYTANLRTAVQTDTFVTDGTATQVLEPLHTYHGFRYVAVTGLPSAPTASQMQSSVLHADTKEVGSFTCSNATLNTLWGMARWAHRSNHMSIPTDCPQRDERLGWSADAMLFARSATFSRDNAAWLAKYTQDLVDGTSAGKGPDVAPYITQVGRGNAGWADAVVVIPWTLYQVYGDTKYLSLAYSTITTVLANLPWSSNSYGDYLNLSDPTNSAQFSAAVSIRTAQTIAKIATVLGDASTANSATSTAASMLSSWQSTYVTSTDGTVSPSSQTAYVLGLAFGLIPAAQTAQAAAKLANLITTNGLKVGFVGLAFLYDALADNGQLSLAYSLATSTVYPSLGYAAANGATTTPEQWNPRAFQSTAASQDANSYNHPIRGCILEWLMRDVAGIDLDASAPGYANVILRPRPGGGVTYAQGAYEGPRGRIESDWNVNSKGMSWHVVVPPNSTAILSLPPAYGTAKIAGADISTMAAVASADPITGGKRYSLPSGAYDFNLST